MLKTIFITVGWTPGRVLFVDKKKKILQDDSTKTMIKEANELRLEVAQTASTTHFGKSVEEVFSELYFQVYEDKNCPPVIQSLNAPN